MPHKPEIRGEVFKKNKEKEETSVAAGEFEAKRANPEEDARKMKKIMEKQTAEDNRITALAEEHLRSFVNHDSTERLFDFFYHLSSIKDMARIDSFLDSLPSQYLAHISDKHLESIRQELGETLAEEIDEEEVADLKRELRVLDKLARAVDNAR